MAKNKLPPSPFWISALLVERHFLSVEEFCATPKLALQSIVGTITYILCNHFGFSFSSFWQEKGNFCQCCKAEVYKWIITSGKGTLDTLNLSASSELQVRLRRSWYGCGASRLYKEQLMREASINLYLLTGLPSLAMMLYSFRTGVLLFC